MVVLSAAIVGCALVVAVALDDQADTGLVVEYLPHHLGTCEVKMQVHSGSLLECPHG